MQCSTRTHRDTNVENATVGEILDGWSGQEANTHSLEILVRVEDGCLEAMTELISIRKEWSQERSCPEWLVLIIFLGFLHPRDCHPGDKIFMFLIKICCRPPKYTQECLQ